MLLFAPLFRLWPHPFWLFAALLAAYLAVPLLLYRVCRDLIGGSHDRALAYLLGGLWLVYPPMTAAERASLHNECVQIADRSEREACLEKVAFAERWE